MDDNFNLVALLGISYITVCYVGLSALFLAAFIYIFKPKVIGLRTRAQDEEQAATASTSSDGNSVTKNPKAEKKTKKPEDAVPGTKLAKPIEDVIKESVKEDSKSKSLQSKKKAKPNQGTVKESKPKLVEPTKSDKSPKKKVASKPKDESTKATLPEAPVDDIGFSFFPVKEKSKSKKNKDSPSSEGNKKSKESSPKSSIPEIKRSPEATIQKKSAKVSEVHKPPVIKHVEEKSQLQNKNKTEVKESKKVCSSISFASVLTNTIPEIRDIDSSNKDDRSAPVKEPEPSQSDEIDTSSIKPNVLEVTPENSSEQILLEISSSSSSIEVITEDLHNTDENSKESSESQRQFEIIEQNLNKLVQSSDSEDILCRSQNSSISVCENLIEGAEAEIAKKEEKQLPDTWSTANIKAESSPVKESAKKEEEQLWDVLSTDNIEEESSVNKSVEKEEELPETLLTDSLKEESIVSESVEKEQLPETLPTDSTKEESIVSKSVEKEQLPETLPTDSTKEESIVSESVEKEEQLPETLPTDSAKEESLIVSESVEKEQEQLPETLPTDSAEEESIVSESVEKEQLPETLPTDSTKEESIVSESVEKEEQLPETLPTDSAKEESIVSESVEKEEEQLPETLPTDSAKEESSIVSKSVEKEEEHLPETFSTDSIKAESSPIKETTEKGEKQLPETLSTGDIKAESSPVKESDSLIESTKNSNIGASSFNSDTFIVSKQESKPPLTVEYRTRCQDCVEIIVADCLKECEEKALDQYIAAEYCIIEEIKTEETPQGEDNNISEILSRFEELQLLENPVPFTQLEESSNFQCEHQSHFGEGIVEESIYLPGVSTGEKPIAEEVNKEFLRLEENIENNSSFKEIPNSATEEHLHLEKRPEFEKSEETQNQLVFKEIQNLNNQEETAATENRQQSENGKDTPEEIQKDLNNSQFDEDETELKENITPRSGEFYEDLHSETENKLDFEQLHNKLNNSQLINDESEPADFKIEKLPFDLIPDCQEHLEDPQEVILTEGSLEVFEDEELIEMASSQIRVLTLNDKEHQECTLYRIEKNWAIQFRLGPSLFGRKVYLYCNYPIDNKGVLAEFNRGKYQLLGWVLDEGCKNADDTAVYTQIEAKLSGSFHYYFTFEKSETAARQGSGFFLVDPILKYGNNEDLPLDCIQCQTVLAKSLGSFSTWEKKLRVAKESGYNMVHFTPIQELGVSNSSYSLSEQLKLNPVFKKDNGKMPSFQDIKALLGKIRKDWKVTSICDIVLNHTANESEWIKIHPEVTYNCVNCPYMRPAYLLDAAFHQFSMDVKNGFYEDKGIPVEVDHEDHLNAIRYHFRRSVLEPLKIEELFICDTNKLASEFFVLARNTSPVTVNYKTEQEELRILQDGEFRRLAAAIDMTLALKLYNVYRNDSFDEDSRLKRCTEEFKSKLDSLNNAIIVDVNDHLTAAVENVIAGIRYFRVQPDGPRVKEITIKNPLVYRYFTDHGSPKSIQEHEETMYGQNGRFLMAHNGWVMNSDPLKNFAAPDSNVYLRRELIAWGDSVKLRYGDGPKDCPFLWEHMRKYVEQTAEIFDGVRLDNCHSTPIPVAEYLLDCARRVRPDLYVVAELFTNSDMTDNIFVNRLGITSLIREAMSAWDSHEEGRLVYRYGGSPVGSFYQPRIRPLVPSVAHALFLDLTHDNPSPVEKRSIFDLLPSTALVNMACCASGSNRGYDELVPHHIHVVDETRQYSEWTEDENLVAGNSRYVTRKSGIIVAKKAINDIHFTLGKEGYSQVYVDQMDPDIVAVTRHRPDTHESYILVAFTAFGHPNEDAGYHQRGIKPLRFEGVLDEIVLEATLSHVNLKTGGSKFARPEKFVKDPKWVNGLSEYQVALKQHIQANESDIFEKVDSWTPNVTQLNFKNFKPGSVVVIKTSLPETMKEAVKSVRSLINQFSNKKETELSRIIDKLTLADLNRAIYRCDQEERDEGFGFDTYHIPNFGALVYAGLQGFISLLANIRPNNDLGHPMCANLRDGNWMIEYIWKRLKLDVNTQQLGQWIEENTKFFNNIPRYLVPSYFDVVVTGIYVLLVEQCYKLSSNFVSNGSTFVRGLSLGSVQFAAYIKSADLPVLSPNLAPPKPPTRKNDKGETVQACVTLSAGLPHFSVGYMRNWGRDTFISLRGLFILTGRFEEARQHILAYGACLRHGLIPNLLDGGRNSRFNCRDAVWWWLYCIKEYVEEAPNGSNILADKVSRIFPTDDSPARPPGAADQPLHDVIQEALRVHFQGLTFRERNAGRQIDEHMTDVGFNNQIGVHPETGFVFGGNRWNCGTWMDKMGSSDKAGNRGKPATPRDGSAVELVGLSKAVVSWLWKLSQNKKYPYDGVERTHKNGAVTKWTFKEWGDKIQANFEKYFWVNDTPVSEEYRSDLVNKRGIYKDSFGASQDWADFQLRCNFPIAMVAAPELFTPQHAWKALNQAEKYLLGPLGMKTLDPEDWAYHGDYDNSNDSEDPAVAHGFNYHQGPEWVWPVGFFLRAKLHFASLNGVLNETIASTKVVLSKHFTELQSSAWRGLPELTNGNGSYCRDSSRTQAWSMACVLEVLHDLQKIESSNQPVLIN